MLGSIAQLVQSVCLTSRGSGVRLPLLPLQEKHFGFLRCFFHVRPARTSSEGWGAQRKSAQRKIPVDPDCVRAKTFSAHIASRIHHVVRESGVFTHERILLGQSHQTSPLPRWAFDVPWSLVPNKRFKLHKMPFATHLVPSKTFSRNKWFL